MADELVTGTEAGDVLGAGGLGHGASARTPLTGAVAGDWPHMGKAGDGPSARARVIEAATSYIRELFAGDASGHDVEHSLRVWRMARRIAQDEPGCDALVVSLAALLHDADDHKLFQTEDNANARRFLVAQGVDASTTERICEAIASVSFSQNRGRRPQTLEGQIVQDADRLDAMGSIGIARTFAYGGAHGRALDDSVQHFHDKLLLLAGEMNTEAGRALAKERHAFLEEFLRRFEQETMGE